MRDGERLVKVEVTYVGTNHPWACQSDLSVHVGAVHVDLTTMGMNQLRDFEDRGFEHPVCRRIRDHQGAQVRAVKLCLFSKIVHVNVAVFVATNNDHLHACHDRTGGVGAMRAVGDEAHVSVGFAPRCVVSPDHHQARKFALGSRVGLQGNAGKSRDFRKVSLELGQHGARATGLVGRTERVKFREGRPRDRNQFRGGVQLHGAGS